MIRIVGLLVLVWLIVGAIAAGQQHAKPESTDKPMDIRVSK